MNSDITKQVAEYLHKTLDDYRAKDIRRSVYPVIERMARKDVLQKTCQEIGRLDSAQWQLVLDCIIDAGAFYSPEKIKRQRDALKEADQLCRQISARAHELSKLLDQYGQLRNDHTLSAPMAFNDPFDLADLAGKESGSHELDYRYGRWVQPRLAVIKRHLDRLRYRFDDRYYPTVSEMIAALAEVADNYRAVSDDSISSAAIDRSHKTSTADYYRALVQSLAFKTEDRGGLLPNSFKLSQSAMAEIIIVALDLPDSSITEGNVQQWKRTPTK